MKTNLFLSSIFLLALVSCSDKDEPSTKPSAYDRLAAIIGTDYTEKFLYDESGKITRWKLTSEDSQTQTNYSYPSSEEIHLVTMNSTKDVAIDYDSRSIFDETLHIGKDGLIEYTDGIWTEYEHLSPTVKRRYRLEFVYDTSRQLVAITSSEWRPGGDEWEDTPWTWTNTLEWNDGKIVKYTDYLGNRRPNRVIEYSYFGTTAVSNYPEICSVLRKDYTPLQTAGLFGKRSQALVDRATTTWENGQTSVTNYAYTFSTSATASWLESYTATFNGNPEQTYLLKWE